MLVLPRLVIADSLSFGQVLLIKLSSFVKQVAWDVEWCKKEKVPNDVWKSILTRASKLVLLLIIDVRGHYATPNCNIKITFDEIGNYCCFNVVLIKLFLQFLHVFILRISSDYKHTNQKIETVDEDNAKHGSNANDEIWPLVANVIENIVLWLCVWKPEHPFVDLLSLYKIKGRQLD